jgi:AcrR family transcriptional regulator
MAQRRPSPAKPGRPKQAGRPSVPAPVGPRDPASTRERILSAAEVEFAAHGFRGARVQEIVARAGVNERMLYHHFGDKKGLYEAVFFEFVGVMGAALRSAVEDDATADPVARLEEVLRRYFDVVVARPTIVRLIMHEATAGWPSLLSLEKAHDERLSGDIFRLFDDARAAGSFRPEVDARVAFLVAGSAFWCIPLLLPRLQHVFASPLTDPAEMAALRDGIVDVLLKGISAR